MDRDRQRKKERARMGWWRDVFVCVSVISLCMFGIHVCAFVHVCLFIAPSLFVGHQYVQ